MRWIDRFLKMEEINGANTCPTYLYRWTLFRTRFFAIYLHHFIGNDWAGDPHDHPKRFTSIGLFGRYREWSDSGVKTWVAPWIRTFPATHRHRIEMIDGGQCWTLVIVGRASRPWGFWPIINGVRVWMGFREYIKSPLAKENRDC